MVALNFLTAGPEFTAELPEPFAGAIPESETVLDYGAGGRVCAFMPTAVSAPPPSEDYEKVDEFAAPGGYAAQLFEGKHLPKSWIIRWPLRDGYLETHVRDLEGRDTAVRVVAGIEIDETDGRLPFILTSGQVRSAVGEGPHAQERLMFFPQGPQYASGDQRSPGLVFLRPSAYQPLRTVVLDPPDDWPIAGTGTDLGFGIETSDELRQTAESRLAAIVSSVTQA